MFSFIHQSCTFQPHKVPENNEPSSGKIIHVQNFEAALMEIVELLVEAIEQVCKIEGLFNNDKKTIKM